MTKLIDIHAHTYYQQKDTVLLLNVFPKQNENFGHPCYFSTGLHPWHINAVSANEDLAWIERQTINPRLIALGETGLDKTISVPWQDQAKVFEKHVQLSVNFSKPLIIHCVRSYNEMILYRNRSDQNLPWIFHWFSASREIGQELMRRNCYLSFGHMLFNEKSKACKVFPEIPPDRIFLETDDAGYPIQEIYRRAAAIRGMSYNELVEQVNSNFITCFGIT